MLTSIRSHCEEDPSIHPSIHWKTSYDTSELPWWNLGNLRCNASYFNLASYSFIGEFWSNFDLKNKIFDL
jgi:hypothetical protein